ncbi:hypothetical protein K443DRAFT_99737 [Laccaria amethystina LaAM-08-1]|uniref:Unplaced genomic scaffold K443scaffold_83, whole genome shotgun sequence n=1 Tax=Laccaria amethystina LaAM-08-1 TaxID=1095629 RepID=A0A0C9XGV4_9AGAR|nr:hypothetical protein K443DRAFT_99737 [Laccaria amethystina LaAM-08-1]
MNRRRKSSIDQDITVVKAQLDILRRREAEYQTLLGGIRRLMDTVHDERVVLEAKEKRLDAQKKPINWLPTEILVDIFVECTTLRGRDDQAFCIDGVQYHSPMVISHVCQRWRCVALATPRLWSQISFQDHSWNPRRGRIFTARSRGALLDLRYSSSTDITLSKEAKLVDQLLTELVADVPRIRSLVFQCKAPQSLEMVIKMLVCPDHKFSQLQSLDLCAIIPGPAYSNTIPLLSRDHLNDTPVERAEGEGDSARGWSGLRHLVLEEVPLLNLPKYFLVNLRSLVLVFCPRKNLPMRRTAYLLKMSCICQFLSLTPRLEELTLDNIVPFFDVMLSKDAGGLPPDEESHLVPTPPVRLDHLKTIDWSYPYAADVHRFMSFLDVPRLVKLDLQVEELPPKRSDMLLWRGYQSTSPPASLALPSVVDFPSLRDLSLQCAGEEPAVAVVRKFTFPVLEKIELANVDTAAQSLQGGEISLPILPRLESILRDPRLPHLTHLTLSRFTISPEYGRADAVLGYMPVLISLSLDACGRVGRLLKGLEEKIVGPIKPQPPGDTPTRPRRGVKVCPRLEALSFWGCHDLEFASVLAVVRSRNRPDVRDAEETPKIPGSPKNKAASPVTGVSGRGKGVEKTEEVAMGRQIRPLRKLQVQSAPAQVFWGTFAPSSNIVSTLIAAQEAFQPAHIAYIRIKDCKLVTEADALSLKDLAVADMMWTSS